MAEGNMDAMLKTVAEAVREAFELKGKQKENSEKEFDKLCSDGKKEVTIEVYLDHLRSELQKNENITELNLAMRMEAKKNWLKKSDLNGDGVVTKAEFLENRALWEMNYSLDVEDDDSDDHMDLDEFTGWLKEWCSMNENTDQYVDVIVKKYLPENQEKFKRKDLLDNLFKLAFKN